MDRERLTHLLEHLSKIPISQIEDDKQRCGICWDAFSLIEPQPEGPSSRQEKLFGFASNQTVGEAALFQMNASTSSSQVVVETEVSVEAEMLPETFTHYQSLQRGEGIGSGGFDNLSHLRAVDDPVQMQCGHIFGGNCLRAW